MAWYWEGDSGLDPQVCRGGHRSNSSSCRGIPNAAYWHWHYWSWSEFPPELVFFFHSNHATLLALLRTFKSSAVCPDHRYVSTMSLVNFIPLPRTACRHHIVQLYNHTCMSAMGAITVPSMAQVHPSYGRMPYLVQKRPYNMVSIPPQTQTPDGFERGRPRLGATPTLKNVRSAFTCLTLWSKHEHVIHPGCLAVGEHQPAHVQRVSHIHILVHHCRHHPH